MWMELGGEGNQHRIVMIEYQDGWPFAIITEKHWDHSKKPWFKPGRDRPNGTVQEYWDCCYSRTEETLYFHNSGSGGKDVHLYPFVHWKRTPGRIWVAPGIRLIHPVYSRARGNSKEKLIVRDFDLFKLGYRRLHEPLMLSNIYGEASRSPFEIGQEGRTIYCEVCEDHRLDDGCSPCEHITWCDECCAWIYRETKEYVDSPGRICDCPREED